MKILHLEDVAARAKQVAWRINNVRWSDKISQYKIYGVPRGGVTCAALVANHLSKPYIFSETADTANIIVDDIEDSGKTRSRYEKLYPQAKFFPLFTAKCFNTWILFPWESSDETGGLDDAILRICQKAGATTDRDIMHASEQIKSLIKELKR